MVSSEMPELLSVCDTICVFRDGGIRMTYAVREATEEKISTWHDALVALFEQV